MSEIIQSHRFETPPQKNQSKWQCQLANVFINTKNKIKLTFDNYTLSEECRAFERQEAYIRFKKTYIYKHLLPQL